MNDTLTIRTLADALPLVAGLARRVEPGIDVIIAFDREGVLEAILAFESGTSLAEAVEMIAEVALPGERLLIVSNRTGEVPLDRPDDEFDWDELAGIARANEIVLLDWFVLSGTKAFSVAEFAPTPAAWPTG